MKKALVIAAAAARCAATHQFMLMGGRLGRVAGGGQPLTNGNILGRVIFGNAIFSKSAIEVSGNR